MLKNIAEISINLCLFTWAKPKSAKSTRNPQNRIKILWLTLALLLLMIIFSNFKLTTTKYSLVFPIVRLNSANNYLFNYYKKKTGGPSFMTTYVYISSFVITTSSILTYPWFNCCFCLVQLASTTKDPFRIFINLCLESDIWRL